MFPLRTVINNYLEPYYLTSPDSFEQPYFKSDPLIEVLLRFSRVILEATPL